MLGVVNKLFVFSSKAEHGFFSFLKTLLNGHKNSNFFTLAVSGSDSMKWNYGGQTDLTKKVFTFAIFMELNKTFDTFKLPKPQKNRSIKA